MNILSRLKEYFNNIFKGKEVKLLESGIELQKTKENTFKENIKNLNTVEWKNPNFEMNPIIMYKGTDISFIPLYLLNPPIITNEYFDYDGANKYTFKESNLEENKEKEFEISKKITDMAVDTVGIMVMDSQFSSTFNKLGAHIRFSLDMANYLHKNGDDVKAIEKQDNLLKEINDFRCKIKELEEREDNSLEKE